jgi:hypothetical protein
MIKLTDSELHRIQKLAAYCKQHYHPGGRPTIVELLIKQPSASDKRLAIKLIQRMGQNICIETLKSRISNLN